VNLKKYLIFVTIKNFFAKFKKKIFSFLRKEKIFCENFFTFFYFFIIKMEIYAVDYFNIFIILASENGHLEIVKLLIQNKTEVNHKNNVKYTALILGILLNL
jgi:hypothetical protein